MADGLPKGIPFLGHLWFLQYLFLISLISLPLLLYLKSRQGRRWVAKFAEWCDKRGGVTFLPFPPDDYPLRRMVRYTVGQWHPDQASNHRRGLLPLDHDLL